MRNLQEIINKMSLKDKLLELTQLYGQLEDLNDGRMFMGISYGFEVDEYMEDNVGSILGISGAKALRCIQENHLKKSKHKIPLLFMHDIIHGYKTIFPSSLAMSCSWQPKLISKAAEVAAKEASVSGLHLTFSPMVDLARDARWGRVIETNGEDVYLNSLLAKAYVKGYQGDNIADRYRIASCVKHFAAYGMVEAGRDYNTTEVSEYSLRENHFPAYKAALDAGAKMVMTSFNALNGVPATGNKWLYREVLRKEFGFTGVVISDCTAVVEMCNHAYAEDHAEAAQKAIEAGVDIEMVSTTYYRNVKKLVEKGKLDEKLIDESVLNVLKLKEELGLFDNPYKDLDEELEKEYVLCREHRDLAREVARNSIVLLKNDGTLPLKKDQKNIALIGPYADNNNLLDVWKAYGEEKDCATLKEALSNDFNIKYSKGCGINNYVLNEVNEALEVAKNSDLIILALGEDPLMSGEAGSRAYINLPGYQETFAQKIFDLGKPVVVVLFNGRPLAITNIDKNANAILETWYPGTEGCNALRDIIAGEFSPTARLTITFPYTLGQCPIYYNQYNTGRPIVNDEDPERFKSRFLDAPNAPLYPFGFGLSYTTFDYSDVALSCEKITKEGSLKAAVKIKNTGKLEGTEVVQLYLRDMSGSLIRPIKMLKGFERVSLKPGEEKFVEFIINNDMLKFNTLENGFDSEKGKFRVYIGSNSSVEDFKEFELI